WGGGGGEVRGAPSPLISALSPTTTIATFDSRAALVASSKLDLLLSMMSQPPAYDIRVEPAILDFIASRGVTASSARPSPEHEPRMSRLLSASGPITAIASRFFERGRRPPSFLSSTIDREAI